MPIRSLGWASSMSRQYQAVWFICSKQLSRAAAKNSQKLLDTDHTRQATAQPKKSPSMVVNFRPSLSARMPPKKDEKHLDKHGDGEDEANLHVGDALVYMYRVAKGAIKL